jgi:hypothetical protein
LCRPVLDSNDLGAYPIAYRQKLLDGIDGFWVPLSILEPKATDVAVVASACGRVRMHIVKKDEFTFVSTRSEGSDYETITTYTAMGHGGGNAFVVSPDTGKLMHADGLDRAPTPGAPKQKETELVVASGIATIARPSPDILVIQLNYQTPRPIQ